MARLRMATMDEEMLLSDEPRVFDVLHSSSWPAAVAPPRRRPEPPKAPLRRPMPAHWEVPPLELPDVPLKRRSLTASTASLEGSSGAHPASNDSSRPASAGAPLGSCGGGSANGEVNGEEAGDAEEDDEPFMFDLDGGPSVASDDADENSDDDVFLPKATSGQDRAAAFGFKAAAEIQPDGRSPTTDKGSWGKAQHRAQTAVEGGGATSAALRIMVAGTIFSRSWSGSMSPRLGASPVLLSALEHVAAEAEITERIRRGTL
eukprot:CAMPEP_0183391068 /NCGR_PEP_ID=MMETSP0370-20130417/6205_1 /TAXON_ID=268820 /ORGANISM="Peridinium aciculiferum, Strain PAER-2" /LENGTH=260 /DNA_ID=CAMNT_0025570733 /DNA_START=38 /DNA_END=820 /DNA_ORIENTATION=+